MKDSPRDEIGLLDGERPCPIARRFRATIGRWPTQDELHEYILLLVEGPDARSTPDQWLVYHERHARLLELIMVNNVRGDARGRLKPSR